MSTKARNKVLPTMIVKTLEYEFESLHISSRELVQLTPAEMLYWQPRASSGGFPVNSCGEHVLRSAAAVEQAFGGITANLWDDPFEWTLPETLVTPAALIRHLDEVAEMRRRGFALFKSDDDLRKEIATAPDELCLIITLLLRTLTRAAHQHGQAFATFRLFSSAHLPQLR